MKVKKKNYSNINGVYFEDGDKETFLPFEEYCIIEIKNSSLTKSTHQTLPNVKCYGYFHKLLSESFNYDTKLWTTFAGFRIFAHDNTSKFSEDLIVYLPEIVIHYNGNVGLDFFMNKDIKFTKHELQSN